MSTDLLMRFNDRVTLGTKRSTDGVELACSHIIFYDKVPCLWCAKMSFRFTKEAHHV